MVSTTQACTHAWARQRQWSVAANVGRDRIRRRRQLNLALLILGALSGAVAAVTIWPHAVTTTAATIAVLALTAAGAVQKRWLTGQELNRWATARAASEAVKSEVYRYLAEVGPYVGPDRDTALAKAVDDAQAPAQDLLVDLHTVTADDRPLPPVRDLNSYVEERAVAQANWHRDRIRQHQKAASRIRAAELAATAIAAVLSALTAASVINLAAWVSAATTIAAAFAAHLAATRHDRIAGSYAATAERLDRLLQRLPANPDPVASTAFVDAVEQVLTAQNEGWGSLVSAPESGS
jgi:SMODS and SLOG-associating 2TM effector domain 1/Protein of unknown function (DUF4231)